MRVAMRVRWPPAIRVPRRVAIGAGAVLVAVGVGAASFGPIVRARVAAMAEARKLDVAIGHVAPGWFAIELEDVDVAPHGATFASAHVGRARVELGALLGVQSVEAHRMTVHVVGTADEVQEQLRAWRGDAKHESSSRARTPIAIDGVSIAWSEREGGAPLAEVTGATVMREADGWRAAFEEAKLAAHAHGGGVSLDVTGGSAQGDASGVVTEGRAARVAFVWTASEEAGDAAKANVIEPVPPPLPAVSLKRAKADHGAMQAPPSAVSWHLPLPEPRAMRAKLVALGAIADARLGDGARVGVDALAFELRERGQRLTVGQGPLTLARKGDRVEVAFRTKANANGTPLELDATLPIAAGDTVVSLAGGPISLALLGVDEGAAGLVEVDRTTVGGQGRVALSANGDALTFDGQLGVRGLAVNNPRLALDVVRGIDATVVARGMLDDAGALRIDDAEVELGALRAVAHGSLEQTSDHLGASLGVELPSSPCEALLQSVPSALVPTLLGAEMSGTFGAKGRIAFDSRNLDDMVFEWNVDDRCAMSVVPEGLAHDRFTQPFEHTIYLPDGTLDSMTTGPTTEAWTDLDHISPFMQVAVLTTEDGAFFRHHGFNRAAIRNALVANLKAGRFVRGASTITMQLAKNLFLSRDKTLSRKLEELVLADYLESAFTKQEMIELYLNVIEFGPSLYGITAAADHYFGRKPAELNLAECLFLSSLLPSPIKYSKLADKPVLSEGWTKHLHELMAIAAKLGTISPEELAEGLNEVVAFHDPKDPAPPPRPAVTANHFTRTNLPSADWEAIP